MAITGEFGAILGPEESAQALQPVDAAFSLARMPGIEHFVDSTTGEQLIKYAEGIPYPVRAEEDTDRSLDRLLLNPVGTPPQIGGGHWLQVPRNCVTLGQALNDAIGDHATEDSGELAHALFAELGMRLARVAREDKVVPDHLDQDQIIFVRDAFETRLMPPLRLIAFKDVVAARRKCIEQLHESCFTKVVSSVQSEQLAEAFKGFEKYFEW